MFNPWQLRAGDTALVLIDGRKVAFDVVRRGKSHLSPIWLRAVFKHDHPADLIIDSRSGRAKAIVAGARQIDGHWKPL